MNLIENNIKTEIECRYHWRSGSKPEILDLIHERDINIAIYDRNIDELRPSIDSLLSNNIEFRASGTIESIVAEMERDTLLHQHQAITADIETLLGHFNSIVDGNNFRLLLATIHSNMCRKFHSDINDLRLLCTYSGPGTLWLTEDNVNQQALSHRENNEKIVIDENKIQQVDTGSVAILKGAIYPNQSSNPIIHRSPTIENKGIKRLLLRVDTNQTMNLWT